jgi:hypothetical protein
VSQGREDTGRAIEVLTRSVADALTALPPGTDAQPEAKALFDLSLRAKKLAKAWERPACLGFFGPSQAGKSFLVGALLSHELGTLKVQARGGEHDFLKEINPAKGVESTGVVTRFSTAPATAPPLQRGDFQCQLLPLDAVLESLATGFLVECTSPAIDAQRLDRCLFDAKLQAGTPASPMYLEAWEAVWHDLLKKYQDRHSYLNDLKRHAAFASGAWKKDVKTVSGWLLIYSVLWGGPGYAPDLDVLFRTLVQGLDLVGHAQRVEVGLELVRASSEGASIIDAACLNSLGTQKGAVKIFASDLGRDVAVEPGVLSALIAEIRLPLKPVPGSLLERADILDFPGGRALKGINGFGQAELSQSVAGGAASGAKLDNAIEVYKRGKLTFLFEQFALEREITALCLCSPGPTKPEAVQLQSQIESWLRIRHGSPTPTSPAEIERPSLFVALTKFDMSLGALRSDNARDRWDSRVQEACVDFWARSHASWLFNWGQKGRVFSNMFWIRNPYADQMQTLKPGEPDYELIKQGYLSSRAVQRHVKDAAEKWAALEGTEPSGLPKSGVLLLADALKAKLGEDVKAKELAAEANHIREDLLALLRAMTPSKDEAEERARVLSNAQALVDALKREMSRRCSGAVFGEFLRLLVVPDEDLEAEVRKAYEQVAPMSIKASDKVKKVLVVVLKWWTVEASARMKGSELNLPQALVDTFLREVCTSKKLMPVLGNAVYPYFSRNVVDSSLVARILEVKVADALLGLFAEGPPRTPAPPYRLSFSEAPGEGAEGAPIDWGAVDFSEEDGGQPKASDVEIVFAGSSAWKAWSGRIGDFYLENKGARVSANAEDPRVQKLVSVLSSVEKVHVDPGG